VKMVDDVPGLLDGLSTGEIATQLGGEYGWSEQQKFRVRAFLVRHKDNTQDLVRVVDHYLSSAVQVLGSLLLIPILAIFFLRDGDHMANMLIQLFFPAKHRQRIRAVASELNTTLTKYIQAQALLCLLSFLFYSASLLLLRFPHAIGLALLGGVLEFIPAVGWMSTLVVIITVGAVSHSHWLWMPALLCIWRLVQDYLTSPRIVGRQLAIHPLAVTFAVLVGAELGGVIGIYLAIPLMASMKVVWRLYVRGEQESLSYPQPAEAPPSLAETGAD
jgi:predicted PurR-regulated permease PerM